MAPRLVAGFRCCALHEYVCKGVDERDITQGVAGAGTEKRVEVPVGLRVVECAPVGAGRF